MHSCGQDRCSCAQAGRGGYNQGRGFQFNPTPLTFQPPPVPPQLNQFKTIQPINKDEVSNQWNHNNLSHYNNLLPTECCAISTKSIKWFNNWNYCWMHRHDIKDKHKSTTCFHPAPGHVWHTTKQNTCGESTKGQHKIMYSLILTCLYLHTVPCTNTLPVQPIPTTTTMIKQFSPATFKTYII